MRMKFELEKKPAIFLTLTYDDVFIPSTNNGVATLDKKHLQDFIKRFRYFVGLKGLKYFACGEYGSRTSRPHYHIALFGIDLLNLETYAKHDGLSSTLVDKAWKFGHNQVSVLLLDRIVYVTKYLDKQYSDAYNKIIFRGAVRPFSLISKGVGLGLYDYLRPFIARCKFDVKYSDGSVATIPPYFINRYRAELNQDELVAYNKKLAEASAKSSDIRLRGLNLNSFDEIIAYRTQRERERSQRAYFKKVTGSM